MTERACRRCGRITWSPHSPYCREHRPSPEGRAKWAAKSRSARGYGTVHKAVRARYARLVAAGQAVCARCGLPIVPGAPFDLDHDAGRTAYLGISHRTCNRREGGRNGAAVTNSRRVAQAGSGESGGPLRHASRVWSWPIEPGMYVDPEAVRRFVEEEADRGVHIDPGEVRAYMLRAASLRASLGLP